MDLGQGIDAEAMRSAHGNGWRDSLQKGLAQSFGSIVGEEPFMGGPKHEQVEQVQNCPQAQHGPPTLCGKPNPKQQGKNPKYKKPFKSRGDSNR